MHQDGKEEDEWYLLIIPNKDSSDLEGLALNLDGSHLAMIEIVTGKIGDLTFANAQFTFWDGNYDKHPSNGGYYPLLYQFEPDGSIRVFGESEEGRAITRGAVQKGRITGEAPVGFPWGGDVHITTDPATLDAYFAEAASMVLTRLGGTVRPLK